MSFISNIAEHIKTTPDKEEDGTEFAKYNSFLILLIAVRQLHGLLLDLDKMKESNGVYNMKTLMGHNSLCLSSACIYNVKLSPFRDKTNKYM